MIFSLFPASRLHLGFVFVLAVGNFLFSMLRIPSDGQQEPRSWKDDYLQTVILHKGNQIAAMQCFQFYLKDSARG